MFRDDVWRYLPLGPVPTIAIGGIGLILLVALSLVRQPGAQKAAGWLLALTGAGVVVVTLGRGIGPGRGNLVPGRTIHYEWVENVNHALGIANVLGNVILFVPVGWLLALLARRSLVTPLLVGCGLSVAIELVQAVVFRSPDIDDVILNTVGTLLGALVASALRGACSAMRAQRVVPDAT